MNAVVGTPLSRVEGFAKVTGSASYAAEFDIDGLVHAAAVNAPIAAGRIRSIDGSAAEAAPGVLAVLTHETAPRLPYRQMEQRPPVDPQAGRQLRVLQGPEVLFSGQPVTLVVADTIERARAAAALVKVDYEPAAASTAFEAEAARPPSEANAESGRPGEAGRGNADGAFEAADVRTETFVRQAREHHNAIEPHVTIAAWDGELLTLHDKTQWVDNDRAEIAHVFGIDPEQIHVISPYVGGAFGSALRTWPHVTLAAVAAKVVGLPVRLELTRRECFSAIGFRPQTDQKVAIGADADGKLAAIIHEAVGQTSVYEDYAETLMEPTLATYLCPNVATRYRLVEMNVNTPCPMRGPGIVTGLIALEMAMDEMAAALRMDPVALRLKNFADHDQKKGLPWSSNELRACYETGAARFGWDRRDHRPGSMRDGACLVGWGMATAIYHASKAPASAAATLFANGTALVRSAASDMGPGTYTSMTQVAADALGLPPERVQFELGDTDLPYAPVHGGSITMASVGNAVAAACDALRGKLQGLDGGSDGDPAEILRRNGLDRLDAEAKATPGEEDQTHSASGFGAVFVEVRIDPILGTVRVPRMVGAYDVGRVINPKIARSQCIGGMVGGLGMALLEQAEWDPRFGRVMNANLAEYLVPVCADIGQLDVSFVPNDDRVFNPTTGAKGLAEIAICGVAPAIANAVWHATGKRMRSLPILPEQLLA